MYFNNTLLNLSIISGTSYPRLTHNICQILNEELRKEVGEKKFTVPDDCILDVEVKAECGKYPNDEGHVKICRSIRRQHVVIVQTACPPIDYHLMQLLMLADAAKRASAAEITAVTPRYFYARSDKKDEPRISITGRLTADLLKTAGVNRIITIELHSPQTQGFFDIFDNFYAGQFLCDEVKKRFHITAVNAQGFVTAALDLGSAKLNRNMAKKLGIQCGAIIDKERIDSFNVSASAFVGDVQDKIVISFDDESLTGGTALMGAHIFKENGAKEVHLCFFQPVFTPQAIEKIEASPDLDSVLAMDTMPLQCTSQKIFFLPSAPLFAEVIKRVHIGRSVSTLF